jgi:hypothetical protein
MRTLLLRSLAAAVLVAAAGTARAQTTSFYRPIQSIWSLSYQMGETLGEVADFVDETSWSGFRLDFRWRVRENLSAGIVTDWSRYDQTTSLFTLEGPNSTVSGPVFRYLETFAVRATAHWYPMKGRLAPYLGLTAGGIWTYDYTQIADLAASDTSFAFAVGPDAGLLVAVGPGLALDAGLSWTWTSADVGPQQDAQYLNWRVGFAWSY